MLIVQREVEAPMFGFRNWRAEDYKKPIEFQLQGAKTRIRLVEDIIGKADPRELRIATRLLFAIRSENPPERILQSVKARGKATAEAAVWIHKLYLETMSRFESLLRVYGGVRNLFEFRDRSLGSFYSSLGLGRREVRWSTDGENFHLFEPFIPKGRRQRGALFKGKQVITPARWNRLQEYVNKKALPADDIMALHRIWAKVFPRDKRLPVIETAILLEAVLRSYAIAALEGRNFSKNKIKNISDDLSFNTCLNLVLPLTLPSSVARRLRDTLIKVDRLRRIRNDIVHDNLAEDNIDEREVKEGIDAGIKLLMFVGKVGQKGKSAA
jgi:hypothetical protein